MLVNSLSCEHSPLSESILSGNDCLSGWRDMLILSVHFEKEELRFYMKNGDKIAQLLTIIKMEIS